MSGKEEGKELRSFPSVVSPSADATGAPTSGGPTRTTPDSAPPPPADPADVFAGEIALTLGLGKSPEAGAWVRAHLLELPGGLRPENIRTAVGCVIADCLERGVKVQWAMIRTRLSAMGGEHRRAKEAEESALKAAAPSRQAEALRKANDHAALRGVALPAAKSLVPQEAL